MVSTLVMHCKSKHILARLTAINWIKEFVLLGKEQLIPHYGELLEAILHETKGSSNSITRLNPYHANVFVETVDNIQMV